MPRHRRYLKMTSLEEARRLFFGRIPGDWGLATEEVAVSEARGRVLAHPVMAIFCSPAYHASAMDGYAVEARLTFAARESEPVELLIGRDVHAVDTGDPLPAGTNAVIMVEDAHEGEKTIRLHRSLSPYENVRLMGEDVVAGELLLPAGKVMTAYDIGLCLTGGRTRVAVRRRPRVGILPTGDELIQAGQQPRPGQIIEFNAAVLAELVAGRGGEPVIWQILPDRLEMISGGVQQALESVDVLVINAGSSAGRDDYTARIIGEMGELVVHGVGIVPGKPTALGFIEGTPVVGLPGYPSSALVSSELFVLPLVDRFLGTEEPQNRLGAKLSRDLPSKPGHAEFVRGQVGVVGGRAVFNPMPRGASLISSYARANAEAEIPEESEGVERGDEVSLRLLVPEAEIGRSLLLAGSNDLCLDMLREELLLPPGRVNLLISTQGSLGGLILLSEGYAHLATCHLLDPETGVYNRPYIERFLPGRQARRLHVALRQQGLMVPKGNPKGIRSLPDLAREEVNFVNRQRGSGTRILLDHLLAREGIQPAAIRGYQREEITHLMVAAAVAGGLADAGLGVLPAAAALGLDFIPLASETFDLVLLEETARHPAVGRLAEIIASASFRRRLEAMGGYDTSISGQWE